MCFHFVWTIRLCAFHLVWTLRLWALSPLCVSSVFGNMELALECRTHLSLTSPFRWIVETFSEWEISSAVFSELVNSWVTLQSKSFSSFSLTNYLCANTAHSLYECRRLLFQHILFILFISFIYYYYLLIKIFLIFGCKFWMLLFFALFGDLIEMLERKLWYC